MMRSWLACVCVMIALAGLCPLAESTELGKPTRAFHFTLLGISVADAKRMLDRASEQKFNTVVVHIWWGASVTLKSFPWPVQTKPWSGEELAEFVRYARKLRMEVVPQIPLLSHQDVLLNRYRPDLMFNQSTYNPQRKEVYELVLPIVDEIIFLTQPKAVHIGHDEVVGWDKRHYDRKLIGFDERPLPAELFLKDVLVLHDYLKKKNIEIWMWGDMLISPDEFPAMKAPDLHGRLKGYGRVLRKKLPRDIVICDWHYFDEQREFPSLKAFHDEGFRVLGATWKSSTTIRNFSKYAAVNGGSGMIATTWFHVEKKDWAIIDQILRESGVAFAESFPD